MCSQTQDVAQDTKLLLSLSHGVAIGHSYLELIYWPGAKSGRSNLKGQRWSGWMPMGFFSLPQPYPNIMKI